MPPSEGGPNEIGALSMGVNVPIEDIAAQLEKVGPIAEKAGEEAGKAFSKGVEKGAAESKPGKWMGEGSDGFVGPARPTGKDEAARQWALANEEAAALNAGGGGGGGGAGAAGAAEGGAAGGIAGIAGAGAIAGAILAAVKMLETAVMEAAKNSYEMGKTLGDALAESQKQQLELTQALRMNAESVAGSQSMRLSTFQAATSGNPNTSDSAVKRIAGYENENIDLQNKRRELTNNPMRRFLDEAFTTGGFGMMVDDVGSLWALNEQIDSNNRSIGINRDQASGIYRREREQGTVGGLAAAAAASKGIDLNGRPMPGMQSLNMMGREVVRESFEDSSPSDMRELIRAVQKTDTERAHEQRSEREVRIR